MTVTIEAVDAFYLAMPEVRDIGDGSQDMLLVKVSAAGHTGWGECEASPLVSIASLVCPMSHSACHPVLDSVLGAPIESPEDIARIVEAVRANSLDLLQAPHTLSGIEIALWDLLGRARQQPVYELLGFEAATPKTAYASALFGDDPQATRDKAERLAAQGYRAAKFGWGPYGRLGVEQDADQVHAAREGLGPDCELLVDAGTVWVDDVEQAALRLPALQQARVRWLEEPFVSGALDSYSSLAARCGEGLRLAGGEGAHNAYMAYHLMDHGGLGYVQIDAGRVGGIAECQRVLRHAKARGIQYVNHTFTSYLALSASLQPFAGSPGDWLSEYPVEATPLARELTRSAIPVGEDGTVRAPEGVGLGLELDLEAVRPYLVELEIELGGRVLYRTPALVP
jgi:L-alanine-DL-glutamate epimerase-like enolase superfamily enzyme